MTERIRIFVASPGDVEEERNRLEHVISDVNIAIQAVAPEKAVALEFLRWQTHVHPDMGRPQDVINKQIGHYDIFVGIMWTRFGTPSGVAASGTEEEFRLAFSRWKQEGTPHILFYFSQAPTSLPKTPAEAEQLARVVAFRSELSQNGLVKEYRDANEFADIIRRDLLWLVGRMVNVDQSPVDAARRVGELALGSATSTVRQQILDLAREYERIRADMPAGDQRTRTMEIIVTRMRTIATEVYPLLEEFSRSSSPGERLAAVAMLQVIPNFAYMHWLVERFRMEQPFVQYHAGVALLSAVRSREISFYREKVRHSLLIAKDYLGSSPGTTGREAVLEAALRELNLRS